MGQSDLPQKIHPLTFPSRLLFFLPGIVLALLPIIFAFNRTSFSENWTPYLFFLGMAGISLYCGMATKLVTTPDGIKNYYFPPLFFIISWKSLNFIGRDEYGIVHLFYSEDGKTWFQGLMGGKVQLSFFVDDWQNSELIAEIRKHAPHVKIPDDVLTQPKLKLWQRPGMLLLYYTVSLVFVLPLVLLTNLDFLKPIHFTLGLAAWGFFGGILGGMSSLLPYSSWLKYQTRKKFFSKIGRMAKLNYALPFRGWALLFVFGLIAQGLFLGWSYSISDHNAGLLNALSFLVGMIQAVFVPYMKPSREA